MNNRNLAFFCGLAAGFALKGACDALARPARSRGPRQDIRPAGRSRMENPPRNWDIVDEQGDESFPASDPPGNY
ncbi:MULTISPECIES: hypothetical protein [Paracoccus]|jgi:hypothetical protein|uniref:Uncharacterized protein n=1 Tax=Paracoccus denitrificans (strain Pd 1222) TaxID=318586 RepID=A1B147_PARDP|nr:MULTISPECIES: hypothetical protein [Paracoccus]ABL69241.1 hypothetical protein Pden_1133 [Paracoccus denitrificans PD1222]MBB4629106.1 hypothetical protein [Paracoccus denitrificans]MCU7431046.1 hypothetical protein [Paracoccus denitrificans]MDK8874588.1 hypothetical protein [Paracoccus sp. SSJ]QAR27249.1 hypothetical protein EO213_13615 [Paracoccus denitrificans]